MIKAAALADWRIPHGGQRHAWSGMALSRKANPRVQPKPHIQTGKTCIMRWCFKSRCRIQAWMSREPD
jgi:hypothetical protein